MSVQGPEINRTLYKIEVQCGAIKNLFDRAFGMCVVCGKSTVAAVHDSDNPGSHWFVRKERPGDGV